MSNNERVGVRIRDRKYLNRYIDVSLWYPPRGSLSLTILWVSATPRPLKMLLGHRDSWALF